MMLVSLVSLNIVRNMFSLRRSGDNFPVSMFTKDHRFRTVGRQIEWLAKRHCDICISPETPIREAVGSVGKNGGRIYFTEGLWNFNESFTIDSGFVQLISMSPGQTIFRRSASMATSDPIIQSTGDGSVFEGIRFIDETDAVSTSVLKITGNNTVVRNCAFEDYYNAILVDGANYVKVLDCEFTAGVNRAIEYSGTCRGGIVTSNVIERGGGNLYFGDNVSEVSVIANTFDATNTQLSYFAGQSVETGSALNVIDPSRVEERC
jgi:hypothetical protein|tara:strand:+ start:3667 stop:4455 length:789 start_codon:yes stop_codon:yes gene_type:complete